MSGETGVADPQFGGMVLVELQYPKNILKNPVCFSNLLTDLQGKHPGWPFVLKGSAPDVDFLGYIPPLPDESCAEQPGSPLTIESTNPAYPPPTQPVLIFKVLYHCTLSPNKAPDEVKTVCTDINTYFSKQFKVLQYPDIKSMHYYSN